MISSLRIRPLENAVQLIGALAGLISLSAPIILVLLLPDDLSATDRNILYTVYAFASLSFLLSLLLIAYALAFHRSQADNAQFDQLQLKIQSTEKERDIVAQLMHNIAHESKNQIAQFSRKGRKLQFGIDVTNDEIQYLFRNYFMYNVALLSNIKDLFDALTGENCAISIKFSDEDMTLDGRITQYILPFMRDAVSYRHRRQTDLDISRYEVSTNSAFAEILNPGLPDSYYAKDNLKSVPNYVNVNPRWRKHYNATLVVPIRYEMRQYETGENRVYSEYDTLGFLCIDNQFGALENLRCIEFANAVSDIYYSVITAFAYFAYDLANNRTSGDHVELERSTLDEILGSKQPSYVYQMIDALERMVNRIAMADETELEEDQLGDDGAPGEEQDDGQ